jgi:hypothetical protein
MTRELSYKTHILIGVGANGAMTVIADWPHLPKQAEVQDKINKARDGYVAFALCTPTSILRQAATETPCSGDTDLGVGSNRSPRYRSRHRWKGWRILVPGGVHAERARAPQNLELAQKSTLSTVETLNPNFQ